MRHEGRSKDRPSSSLSVRSWRHARCRVVQLGEDAADVAVPPLEEDEEDENGEEGLEDLEDVAEPSEADLTKSED